MHISHLDVLQVRNLRNLSLDCHPRANIFHGVNGSGKTSLLESLHLLGRGRSFRHRDLKLVVNHEAKELVVSAQVLRGKPARILQMGIKRSSSGEFSARVDGKTLKSAGQLASALPIQLIDAHSFNLLEGGPLQRRQFIDWGVFHVEPSYFNVWKRFQKALKQRNQLLRHGRMPLESLKAWTAELLPLSEQITASRHNYLRGLVGYIEKAASAFEGLGKLDIDYYQGWDEHRSLGEVLDADKKRDLSSGVTNHGAHKADIRIKVDGVAASESLSRGQTKLLVYALKLAQATYYRDRIGEACVFLLDDLPAELDYQHRQQVVSYLYELGSQFFVTGVDKRDFDSLIKDGEHQMFHMEHGAVI
jgi:DNA replication and repair protein RecF